jgi:exodeoxyribonuclease VII small subunit
LEDSLKLFERGVRLARSCQQALQEAEHKVHILLDENGEASLQPFTDEP